MSVASERATVIRRRIRSIGAVVGMFAAAVFLAPVALAIAVMVDLGRWLIRRTPFMSVRLYLFGVMYLTAELAGTVALGAIWAATLGGRHRRTYIEATYAVQRMWTSVLLRSASTLFGLRISVDNSEAVQEGPLIVLARHASIVDNLLPAHLIAGDAGLRLRYVLKKELLRDPCLDIAGSRLPNYFVDRTTEDRSRELSQIRALAEGLTDRDAVLIFPEGTRFTPARKRRAIASLEASSSPFLARAQQLRHVLPPKLGGVAALLQAAPTTDVVVLGHHGLEGFARVGDLWRQADPRREIRVRFWRHSARSIPSSREGRADWLFEQWAAVDEWIDDGMATA